MKLTKNMIAVLNERWGDTTKAATADKMAEMGMITITSRWVTRGGNPAQIATGTCLHRWVVSFTVNESHPLVAAYRAEVQR
jgi:hypothetical protein